MAFLNEEVQGQLKEIFEGLSQEVNVAVFSDDNCETCEDNKAYLDEIGALHPQIKIHHYHMVSDQEKAKAYGVERTPAIVLLDKDQKDYGVKYYGVPAGHEINSLITGIMEFGGLSEEIPADMETMIKAIDKPVNIKVFVTLGCPHCPGAVIKAHKLAKMNDFITAEMIEANTFGDLSAKFNVSSVPRIFFNDDKDLLGNQPLNMFIETLKEV